MPDVASVRPACALCPSAPLPPIHLTMMTGLLQPLHSLAHPTMTTCPYRCVPRHSRPYPLPFVYQHECKCARPLALPSPSHLPPCPHTIVVAHTHMPSPSSSDGDGEATAQPRPHPCCVLAASMSPSSHPRPSSSHPVVTPSSSPCPPTHPQVGTDERHHNVRNCIHCDVIPLVLVSSGRDGEVIPQRTRLRVL